MIIEMRCWRLGALFAMAFSCLCLAQNSQEYLACSQRAATQPALNKCAADEAKRADTDLNRLYRELLLKRKSDPLALEKLKKFERSWIAYRDACIEAMYPSTNKQAEYGSSFPMEVALLGAKLTRQQIDMLKELISRGDRTESGESKR